MSNKENVKSANKMYKENHKMRIEKKKRKSITCDRILKEI